MLRRGLFTLALLAGCAASGAAGSDARVRSAGCYIPTPAGVVMNVGRFNGKLQLPAGARQAGESPECTARRETYEETGLEVDVGERVAERKGGRFVLFRCVPRQPLDAAVALRAPALFEISRVLVVNPLTLRDAHGEAVDVPWRFPGDRGTLRWLFSREPAGAAPALSDPGCAPPDPAAGAG